VNASIFAAMLPLIVACGGNSPQENAVPVRHSGGLIAFESNRDAQFHIYAIAPNGELRRLTNGPDQDGSPAWSPDGRRLVFVRTGGTGNGVAQRAFYVMNSDGSDLRRLSASYAVDDAPVWSPDGGKIAFTRHLGEGVVDLYVMDARSGARRRLALGGAEVLVQKAEKVARTVEHLLDAGAESDLAAAKALVPWIDQAYGKPTERVEHKYPTSIDELKDMDDEQLVRLVAEGRRKRLQRQGLEVVPDASDWRRRDPTLGVVGDLVDGE
jgi:dipeptidyl aminopeptidase/acylaminoacyl peptidase